MTAGSLRVLNPGNVWGAETELNRDGFYPSLHTTLKPVTRVNYPSPASTICPSATPTRPRSSSASTSASASAASRPWTTSTSPSAAPRSRA